MTKKDEARKTIKDHKGCTHDKCAAINDDVRKKYKYAGDGSE